MTDNSNGFALKRILEEESKLSSQLYEVLLAEKACLAENQIDKLEANTREKESILNLLESSAKERAQFMPVQNQEEFDQLIHHYEPSLKEELLHDWQQLQTLLAKCREQNEINGTVLNINMHNTRRIFDILFGQADRVVTYDKSGNTHSKSDGQGHIKV